MMHLLPQEKHCFVIVNTVQDWRRSGLLQKTMLPHLHHATNESMGISLAQGCTRLSTESSREIWEDILCCSLHRIWHDPPEQS